MNNSINKLLDYINKTFSIKPNAVYDAQDYANLLSQASGYQTYAETVKSEKTVDADTLHYRIQEDTQIELLLTGFKKISKKLLKKFKKKKVVLIIDHTHDPFYGKTKNEWIHKYITESGAKGSFRFLSASILIDEKKYFIYSIPVSIVDKDTDLIELVLDYVKELGIRIQVALIDMGFTKNSKNLKLFKSRNVKYLGLYPKYSNIKKIIETTKRKFINRNFEVSGVKTRLIIGKNVGTKPITWVFVTNLELSEFVKYKKLYKRRWNIETGFRVQDEAQIKSRSVDIRIRYFYFLVAMIMYNLWKSLRTQISFKRFVIKIQKFCEGVVNEIREIKPG